MKLTKSYVPNLITSLNLLSGFLSILYASQGEFRIAALLIIAAAFFDLIDGLVARMMGVTSRFGVELDSLADVVSFGAAPSYIVYSSYFIVYGWYGIIISSLILVFGAFRLARFNVDLVNMSEKIDFKGLPIPISAITIAGMVLGFNENGNFSEPFSFLIFPLVILLAFLMVSKIRYNTFPKFSGSTIKLKIFYIIGLLAGLLLGFITRDKALFYIFISIVLFGMFRHLYYLIFTGKEKLKDNSN